MASIPVPSFKDNISKMYTHYILDYLNEIALAVAFDFSRRIQHYQEIDPALSERISDLQSLSGLHRNYPNRSYRNLLYNPVFGAFDSPYSGPFQTSRNGVILASKDYSENIQPTGFPALKERVKSALAPFRNHLSALEGSSFDQTYKRTATLFNLSVEILRDENIAAVFGISKNISKKWPLASDDQEGAKLVERISTQLPNIPNGTITSSQFVKMQRIAQLGGQSIQLTLQADVYNIKETELVSLISNFYAWGSELGILKAVCNN